MKDKEKVSVLFVCMGNICRSPTAEGVFRDQVSKQSLEDLIIIDSAGTHAYHVGEPPDSRATATARARGIDLSTIRARRAIKDDFEQFDYILAMDNDNYSILNSICSSKYQDRLHLFLDYAVDYDESEVPDPYYGGNQGFDHVFNLVESASKGLLSEIKSRYFK